MLLNCKSIVSDNRGRRRAILVLEDAEFVRTAICKTLVSAGYRATGARTTTEARRIIFGSGQSVCLLIGDIVLPRQSGGDFVLELKASRPGIKTILISGYPRKTLGRGFHLSKSAFLPKPFSSEALLMEVGRVMRTKSHTTRSDHET